MQPAHQGNRNDRGLELTGKCCPQHPRAPERRWGGAVVPQFLAAKGCTVPEGETPMTITSPLPLRSPAIPLTFAALPGGRFPPVLTAGHCRVAAPAGGEPMLVVHRYEDLLSV